MLNRLRNGGRGNIVSYEGGRYHERAAETVHLLLSMYPAYC